MATVGPISQGTAGEIQGTSSTVVLSAPGQGIRYKVTGFSLDYNNNGASFQNTGGDCTFKLISGSTEITIGTYGIANGYRPTIAWSGTMTCPENTGVTYSVTRNPQNGSTPGIRNQYFITITYETEILGTKPSVSSGTVITKGQMDALHNWIHTGTVVTQYDTVWASHGNTYRNTLSAGSRVEASWFNTAAG